MNKGSSQPTSNYNRDILLELVGELDVSGFRPEIFTREALPDWIGSGSKAVSRKARELGLQATQFVVHSMMEDFSTPEKVNSDSGMEDIKQVIEIAKHFDDCRVLTIPVGPFGIQWDQDQGTEAGCVQGIRNRLVEKMDRFLQLVRESGLVLALEVLPFSVVCGIEGFLAIRDELDSFDLGINLDTGHAWACRETVPLLPFRLRDRVFGLHLCDNFTTENLSLAPGKGTIEWKPFMMNLLSSGYNGGLDIEIGCEAENAKSEYAAGLSYVNSLVTV